MTRTVTKFLLTAIAAVAVTACGGRGGAVRNDANGAGEPVPVTTVAQVIELSAPTASDTVHMGRISAGEIVVKPLTLRNAGTEPVVILDVDKTCGCVEVTYPKHPLKAGEEAPMELEFDSRNIKGWVYKTVVIKTSSATAGHLLVVTAEVD